MPLPHMLAYFLQMRHALEARLAAAEEDIKAAEQVKFEKEESARKALAEQEAIMEKVVQESMMLKQEAEENSKVAAVSAYSCNLVQQVLL